MHDHHHGHSHAPHGGSDETGSRMAWAFFLNAGFAVIEFVGGILTNSTAIMADAVHDLGDSLSIGLAWWLSKVSQKPASDTFSYGYRRFSVLGALLNGIILLVGSFWVLSTAIPRLQDPVMPVTEGMLGLAIFGVLVNSVAAYKLSKGTSLNERMLNWHLLEDVLGWFAVLIVSLVLMVVEWPILDPLLSIVFTVFIVSNVLKTLWKTLRVFLQATPETLEVTRVSARLQSLEGVESVHHVHVWSLDGEHHVLSAHVVLQSHISLDDQSALKRRIAETLAPFQLAHTTIEFEHAQEICRDHSALRKAG